MKDLRLKFCGRGLVPDGGSGALSRGKSFAVLFCVVGERLFEYLMRIQKIIHYRIKETFRSVVGVSLEANKVFSLIKVRSTSSFLGLAETDSDSRTAFRESRRYERSTSEAKRLPKIPSAVRIKG